MLPRGGPTIVRSELLGSHFRPPSDLRVLAPLGPAVAALRSNGYVDRFPKAISSGNTFWLRTGCRLF